jgi:hypothetical protein
MIFIQGAVTPKKQDIKLWRDGFCPMDGIRLTQNHVMESFTLIVHEAVGKYRDKIQSPKPTGLSTTKSLIKY